MSGIGLYQAIGQPVPLVEQIREGTPYGTFVSRNSAGGFLNVCLAGAIGLAGVAFATSSRQKVDNRYKIHDGTWLASAVGAVEDRLAMIDSKQLTTLVALALIAVGVFASASRGAIISMIAASLATLAMSTRLSKTRTSWILGILVASISIGLLAALEIDTRIRDRFGMVFEDGVARGYIWEASYRALQFFMMTGSGLGTFHFAALPFQDSMMNGWFYHAENLIIEFFVESGWIGIVIFVCAVVFIFLRINRERPRGKDKTRLPILLATTYLIISCLVHNSVDFPLLVPAVFVPVAILFGVLFCDYSGGKTEKVDTRDQRRSSRTTNSNPKESIKIESSSATPSSEVEPESIGMVQSLIATKSAKHVQFFGLNFVMIAFLIVSQSTMRELASAENFERQKAFLADVAVENETSDDEITNAQVQLEIPAQFAWHGDSNIAESKRLRAESEITAFRRELFETLNENGPVDWKASHPSLFRLAVTRLVKENRAGEIASLAGGHAQLKRLDTATELYSSARQQSPLDWRLMWGEFLGSWLSPREQQLHSIAVLGSMTSNRPNILFQMAMLANELDDRALCSELLSSTMRAAPTMATKVGLFLSQTRKDDEVDASIFPDQPEILESVAARAFPKDSFPKTNAELWQRIVNVAERRKPTDVTRWVWLAKSAKSANNEDLEFAYLEKAAQLERFNVPIQQRLAVLLANRGEFSRAMSALDDCLLLNPSDSNALNLKVQIKQMAEKSQDNSGNR
jgi:O-Antigen ligase